MHSFFELSFGNIHADEAKHATLILFSTVWCIYFVLFNKYINIVVVMNI